MEDQFRPDGVMEKDAPLQPPATNPGVQHLSPQGETQDSSPAAVDPLAPLEIEDGRNDEEAMPSARPVEANGQLEQHAVPVEESKATGTADPSSSEKFPIMHFMIGLAVIIGIILAGVCGSGHCSSGGGDSSKEASSSSVEGEKELSPRGMEIKAELEKTFGPTYFVDESTDPGPHQKALDWISEKDPQQLPPESNHLLQRYAMALFYYSTTEKKDWLTCGAPPKNGQADCYFKWRNREQYSERWLSGAPECRWAGSECAGDTENITGIDFWENGLNGPLPSEIGLLSYLEHFVLRDDDLTGMVPTTFLQLTSLDALILTGHELTGTIQKELFSMLRLKIFNVFRNQFTGTIPTEIGLFPGSLLSVAENSLTGTIPSEAFSATNCTQFVFSENQLSGTIPTEIGTLPPTDKGTSEGDEFEEGYSFSFKDNSGLNGNIPSELGLVRDMTYFTISRTSISGTMPEEVFLNCHKVYQWEATDCLLSGTLSTNMGLLTELSILDLASNRFEGTIPAEIGALTNLKNFTINDNPDLTGTIPDGTCFENANRAKGINMVADCAPTTITESDGTSTTGEPLVSCPQDCCTVCCDAGTGVCMEQ